MPTPKKPATKSPVTSPRSQPATRRPAPPKVSGSASADPPPTTSPSEPAAANPPVAERYAEVGEMVAAMPYNLNKAAEYGDAARRPPTGVTVKAPNPAVSASTISERNTSAKIGSGMPPQGHNNTIDTLDRARVDATGLPLRSNQGVAIADNQNSLKVGARGPVVWNDFFLREKITHFDHERIPERVVHARGSGAHGYFECYESLSELTHATLFAEAGKQTPVFTRFSTVAGERGSADAVRDVRGFAVKFYTDDGVWDLVGNNIPIFFIQDAIKFPDLVHAVKPEQHHAMPQAASAHDTFWDFVSLMPESTAMLMWQMSDRAIPRSYRMMQGFGVHTFRWINSAGESHFVKYHWNPLAGTHSLDWDEAVKINGADSDFHRRDLWNAIETGVYPEYELAVQVFNEQQAEQWSFDVLDATKLVPEELVPLRPIGRMVLNRNPDNFFAETEQVAFCTANIVPGMDFTNDPLLAGRNHSYLDTQLSRLGGPNFTQIPINMPRNQSVNNQRDGFHQHQIPRGRVAYEPNSLAGGCPFQAGMQGFMSFAERVSGDQLRGKPEKFAEHFNQARLFWASQTAVEQSHIVRAFSFELAKVHTEPIRHRVVGMLRNVDEQLAQRIARNLGFEPPPAQPPALADPPKPEVERSPALSLFARPGNGDIATRRVAILICDGVDLGAVEPVRSGLLDAGAVVQYVADRLGTISCMVDGAEQPCEIEATLLTTPSVVFDALIVPGGGLALRSPATKAAYGDFVRDIYKHAKPLLLFDDGGVIGQAAQLAQLGEGAEQKDAGVVRADSGAAEAIGAFKAAIAKHRHFERSPDAALMF